MYSFFGGSHSTEYLLPETIAVPVYLEPPDDEENLSGTRRRRIVLLVSPRHSPSLWSTRLGPCKRGMAQDI